MRVFLLFLVFFLLLLQYECWISDTGIQQTYSLRLAVQSQMRENLALRERNSTIEADIKDLKTGLTTIEERARSEIGMIRQDETLYRILEP